jgi:hypothetical protein
MQEHESPKKKTQLEFKVFFKVLKFLSFFHIKMPFFFIKIFRNLVGVGWGRGGDETKVLKQIRILGVGRSRSE